ncbi:hypothetical protein E4U51_007210 [Claviceps purpurea]|nr:hypothetical protein E4U51_007210 [Claviceps purpurea]
MAGRVNQIGQSKRSRPGSPVQSRPAFAFTYCFAGTNSAQGDSERLPVPTANWFRFSQLGADRILVRVVNPDWPAGGPAFWNPPNLPEAAHPNDPSYMYSR